MYTLKSCIYFNEEQERRGYRSKVFKVTVSNDSLFIQKTDILTASVIHPIDLLPISIFGF